MNVEEFSSIVAQIRSSHPVWFGLESDRLASDEDIRHVEGELSVRLPPQYVEFLKRYGGGYFGFTNVFSADRTSDWYLGRRKSDIALQRGRFLGISDNGVGDYYGFLIGGEGDAAGLIKFWDHETGRLEDTPYGDLFSYLLTVGLKQ